MKAETFLARLLSVAFHPLLVPTLGMLLLFQLDSYLQFAVPPQAKRFILIIVFINTALAPALAVLLLKRTGLIKSMLLDERGERLFPLLLSSLLFFLTYYLLRQVTLPSLIYYYLMGATLLVILCLLITFRWKISLHMMGLGGFTGFLIATSSFLKIDISLLIGLTFLVSGLVGASRLGLGSHTPLQVYVGYLSGAGVMLALFLFLRA
jgi:membrane-associated phospholipid phosphatase